METHCGDTEVGVMVGTTTCGCRGRRSGPCVPRMDHCTKLVRDREHKARAAARDRV